MLRCRNSVFLLSLHSKARALTSSLCADSSLSHTLSLFIPLSFPLSSGIFLSLYFTIPLTLSYSSVTLFFPLSCFLSSSSYSVGFAKGLRKNLFSCSIMSCVGRAELRARHEETLQLTHLESLTSLPR